MIKSILKFAIILLFINVSNAQETISANNFETLKKLINKLSLSDAELPASYLLSYDNSYEDAFLVYQDKIEIIVEINQFTFKSTNSLSESFIDLAGSLGAETSFYTVNTSNGQNKIPTYRFKFLKTDTALFQNIIVQLLPGSKSHQNLIYKSSGA